MSLADWFQWLEQAPVSVAIAESIWLFPILEGRHILALPLSVGMIVIFDLHVLGRRCSTHGALTLAKIFAARVDSAISPTRRGRLRF